MALTSTGGENGRYSTASGPRLQRLGIAAIVAATHVALVLVLIAARGARHPPGDEIVEISFFPLPITPEDRTQKVTPSDVDEPDEPERARNLTAPRGASAPISPEPEPAARDSQSPAHPSESDPLSASGPPEPASSDAPSSAIDWQAELGTAAATMQARAKAAAERRSFTGPPPHTSLTPKRTKPPCPFEECEPGWGSAPSVFDSTASKKGRIEKTPDGEVIRWTSNNCYQILITPNEFHRAMTRCVKALGKSGANGHLLDHMRNVPPPEDRATDVP